MNLMSCTVHRALICLGDMLGKFVPCFLGEDSLAMVVIDGIALIFQGADIKSSLSF